MCTRNLVCLASKLSPWSLRTNRTDEKGDESGGEGARGRGGVKLSGAAGWRRRWRRRAPQTEGLRGGDQDGGEQRRYHIKYFKTSEINREGPEEAAAPSGFHFSV